MRWVRVWLPVAIMVAGVVAIVASGGSEAGWEGGVAIVAAGASVWLLNLIFRLGLPGRAPGAGAPRPRSPPPATSTPSTATGPTKRRPRARRLRPSVPSTRIATRHIPTIRPAVRAGRRAGPLGGRSLRTG